MEFDFEMILKLFQKEENEKWEQKIEENKKKAEGQTAKRRQKRLVFMSNRIFVYFFLVYLVLNVNNDRTIRRNQMETRRMIRMKVIHRLIAKVKTKKKKKPPPPLKRNSQKKRQHPHLQDQFRNNRMKKLTFDNISDIENRIPAMMNKRKRRINFNILFFFALSVYYKSMYC